MPADAPGTTKRAIVTGATRGIGKATSVALAEAGWAVAILGRTQRPGEGRDESDTGGGRPIPGSLEETRALVSAAGVPCLPLVADLFDHDSLRAAAARVMEEWGGVDLLVNNAVDTSPGSMVPVLELTVEQLERKLAANVVSQFVLITSVLPDMVARGDGVIIDVTSYTATGDPPGPVGQGGWGLGYAASKAAFHRMAPLLSVELAGRGIWAFNVDPGYVETERQRVNVAALGLEGRFVGAPPTVPGRVIAWLADHREQMVNGSTVSAQKVALVEGLHPDWRSAS